MKQKFRRVEITFIGLFIFFYSIAAISVSLNRFWQYNAFWYDFGIFDTTIWKLARFQLPLIEQLKPPLGKIVWADHFNPSSLLLAPLYWITSRSEIILIAQVISVGLSALVAYKLSLKLVKNALVRVSLIVSYLGYVGLQNALFTDVHNVVFALLPIMLVIWALYFQKWRLYWLFIVMSLGIQENLATVVMGIGVYLIAIRKYRLGLSTLLIGLAYGLIIMGFLIPALNGGNYTYQPDIPTAWSEWITQLFIPTHLKLRTIFLTFASFGFLPLLSLPTLPLIMEQFIERFVLNTAATRWDLGFHYNAILSPIMFVASLEVITRLQARQTFKTWGPMWALGTIFLTFFFHRFYLHGPLLLATHPVFYEQTRSAAFLSDFTQKIPPGGLLMTQNNIAAHFTHRPTILLNQNYGNIKPAVVAIDMRAGQNANNFYPLTFDQTETLVSSLSTNLNYTKQAVTDSELLFMRKQ